MKKVILLLTIFLLVFTFSTESFAGKKDKEKKGPLSKGSKAMYVSLNSLTNLSFDDASIGAQYLFADRQGINVDLSLLSKTSEAGGTKSTESNFGLTLGYINYVFNKGNVSLYLLPYVGFSSGKDETASVETSGLNAGLGIGSEWWAFRNVSLAAQFSFGFESETIKSTVTNNEVKNSSFGVLGNGQGKFYLTFYF